VPATSTDAVHYNDHTHTYKKTANLLPHSTHWHENTLVDSTDSTSNIFCISRMGAVIEVLSTKNCFRYESTKLFFLQCVNCISHISKIFTSPVIENLLHDTVLMKIGVRHLFHYIIDLH